EGGSQLELVLDQQYGSQHTLGKFRVAVTTAPRPIRLQALPDAVAKALQVEAAGRSKADQKTLADYYRTIDPSLVALNNRLAALTQQELQPQDASMAQTLADLSTPRTTRVLLRGDFLQPGPEVQAHTPAILPDLQKKNSQPNRLDLAHWIVN